MLLTVSQFKHKVQSGLGNLVADLQDQTGRFGEEEADAWRSSLPVVAQMLSSPALETFHLFFGGLGHASVEYQLPAASQWCDMVLLGRSAARPAALVLELKHWFTASDGPGATEGLIVRQGTPRLHPSQQVRKYTEYLRNFHSEILLSGATVNGCVLFTRAGDASAYTAFPNAGLTERFPIFTIATNDVESRFPQFVTSLITEPAPEFAERFEIGKYRQDRGFVSQIGQQILEPASTSFVLLDNQEEAFLVCRERVRDLLHPRDGVSSRRVVIVHGPPGSGKSAVAAKLWAALVTDPTVQQGDVVLTTTSASQNTNWVHLVEKAGRRSGAGGIVKKATGYHPISTATLGKLRRKFGEKLFEGTGQWRSHLEQLRNLTDFQPGSEDFSYLASLIDEAHGLINTERDGGVGQFGFAPTLGPQAYHIIRASRLSVFFMDSDQGYRERENTAVQDIRAWARELGAQVDEIDLSTAQFRCAGSKEFTDWIEIIRAGAHPKIAGRHAERWRPRQRRDVNSEALRAAEPIQPYNNKGMTFAIVDDPFKMDAALKNHMHGGSVRILASYHRPWRTKGAPRPHDISPALQDFSIPAIRDGRSSVWAKPWNFVPENGDYSVYVQAGAGSRMAEDPLCEIGCPYAVRGFDFDYAGIIWGPDLVWRSSCWIVQPEHVYETGVTTLVRRARQEKQALGSYHQQLLRRVWQSYRILLTRAMKGLYVFVEDEETREYLRTASAS